MLKLYFILLTLLCGLPSYAMAAYTAYSYTECEGSAMPYPTPDMALRTILILSHLYTSTISDVTGHVFCLQKITLHHCCVI